MTRIAKESAMLQHITCSRRLRCLFACLALTTIFGIARTGVAAPLERLRIIVETDAGGDPDDEQSLVRFLLYANEWDVEGIIANRPVTLRPENRNRRGSGLEIVREFVDAYAEVYPRLKEHDDRFPEPAVLRARTVAGYDDTDD